MRKGTTAIIFMVMVLGGVAAAGFVLSGRSATTASNTADADVLSSRIGVLSPTALEMDEAVEEVSPYAAERDTALRIEEPIAEFRERITKKYYGIFITPETSPVQPDKFTGYHNGVDVEYGDTIGDVTVYAIADGSVVFQGWVRGYGGVIVLRHAIEGREYFALYGHLDPDSFSPDALVTVQAGEQIGVLGDGYSEETDGVRKHLHFSVRLAENGEDFRGYVGDEEVLQEWIDPLLLYE